MMLILLLWILGSKIIGAIGITGLENYHTGNPIVNLGGINVAMKGGHTFPYKGNTKYIP